MWGTTALHQLGDISRDKGDFCVVDDKLIDGNYIGNWVTGFGFIEVKFPANTTKTLTRKQRYNFNKSTIVLNGCVFKEPKPAGKR